MTNTIAKKVIAAALAVSTLVNNATTATAAPLTSNYRAYEVSFECHKDGVINTGTRDKLAVNFVTTSGRIYPGAAIMQPGSTCQRGSLAVYRSPQIALPNDDQLARVTVSATGQDAMLATVVHVHQYDKGAPNTGFRTPYVGRWANGNGRRAYCFSTDANDTTSQGWFSNGGDPARHIWSAGCTKKITFLVNGPTSLN